MTNTVTGRLVQEHVNRQTHKMPQREHDWKQQVPGGDLKWACSTS